jgi:hypothetical protein
MYRCMQSLSPFIITVVLVVAPFATSPPFARNETCKHTSLYSLTFPPQKEHLILCHPTGNALAKINKSNEQYNKGVEAGRTMSMIFNSTDDLKCPSNHSKDFCQGWKMTAL